MAHALCAAFSSLSLSASTVVHANGASGRVALLRSPFVTGRHTERRGDLVVGRARVGGVEIPNAKRLEVALTYIYGIGPTTARAILQETKMEANSRVNSMTEDDLNVIRAEVDKYMTEGDLRRFNTLNIKRLTEIGCYRGRRHVAGLPVRGQRTKTNSRTRKGKRKTIANKKIAKK